MQKKGKNLIGDFQDVKVVAVLIFFLTFFLCCSAYGADKEILGGAPFLYPAPDLEMSQEWHKQLINYSDLDGSYDVAITLDQHLYPALKPIIEKYGKENNLRIHVSDGTCGISNGKLYKKAVDIAGFCCPPGLVDRFPGIQFHTIGIAAVGIMVHPDNRVKNMSLEQVRQVFSGNIHRWNELESTENRRLKDVPINLAIRLHCKARPGHWRLLLDKGEYFSPAATTVGTIEDVLGVVSTDLQTIGYEVLWNRKRFQKKIKFVNINGYSPEDQQALVNHKYPLYRVFNVTSWSGKKQNPHVGSLVIHIRQQINMLDEKFGIVPVSLLKKAGWIFNGNELVGEPEK